MEIIEINGYHEEEAREALISADRRSGAHDQPDAAATRSQLQPDVSLVRENEALRPELMKMKLYVSDMQKNQVSSTKGKLNPFKHGSEDTFHIDDNSGVDITKPRRRRFSIS
ncbi:hypothetical protein DKX38_020787 [Salix brachista]|uniref:NPH3 domain-containing protein n=1 Tax=Salix brachista TaxID=2182728 RepID=A0A5N5KAU1_9ROSI|nr:hypothetical protein DKX38_020787 [Salix brachista]